MIKKKSRLWKRFIETKNPQTHKEYKKVRNEIHKQTHLIIKKEQCEVAKQCKSNPKKFRKFVSSKSTEQTRISDIKSHRCDGNILLANDDEDKANAFGDCFAAVYTRESDNIFNELPSRHSSVLRENVVFTEEAILDKLTSIKVNKSPGPDLLHPRVLHEARYQLVTPLLLLFEKLYTTGTLPCDWKVASTVPT